MIKNTVFLLLKVWIGQELKKMAAFPTDDLEVGCILHAIDRATKDLSYNKIAN